MPVSESTRKEQPTQYNKRGDLRIDATPEQLAKAVMRPKRKQGERPESESVD